MAPWTQGLARRSPRGDGSDLFVFHAAAFRRPPYARGRPSAEDRPRRRGARARQESRRSRNYREERPVRAGARGTDGDRLDGGLCRPDEEEPDERHDARGTRTSARRAGGAGLRGRAEAGPRSRGCAGRGAGGVGHPGRARLGRDLDRQLRRRQPAPAGRAVQGGVRGGGRARPRRHGLQARRGGLRPDSLHPGRSGGRVRDRSRGGARREAGVARPRADGRAAARGPDRMAGPGRPPSASRRGSACWCTAERAAWARSPSRSRPRWGPR